MTASVFCARVQCRPLRKGRWRDFNSMCTYIWLFCWYILQILDSNEASHHFYPVNEMWSRGPSQQQTRHRYTRTFCASRDRFVISSAAFWSATPLPKHTTHDQRTWRFAYSSPITFHGYRMSLVITSVSHYYNARIKLLPTLALNLRKKWT